MHKTKTWNREHTECTYEGAGRFEGEDGAQSVPEDELRRSERSPGKLWGGVGTEKQEPGANPDQSSRAMAYVGGMDDLRKTMLDAVWAAQEARKDDQFTVEEIVDICATEALVSMKLKLTALFPIFDSPKRAITMAKEFVRRWSEELTNQYGKINH